MGVQEALAGFIVIVSLVQGADLSMFAASMKALEEYFDLSPMALGLVLLLQGLMAAVTAPIWGMLADRHDRIKLVMINLIGISVLTFMTGASTSYVMLCFARLCTGVFSSGLGPIVQTMLASAVPAEDRSKFFSFLIVAGQLGGSAGAVYGASLSHENLYQHQGWRFTFISMSLATFMLAAVMFMMHEYLIKTLRQALATTNSNRIDLRTAMSELKEICSRSSFILLICQGAFASTAYAGGAFLIEVFQYAGFEDFQASTLVGWLSVGNIIGALATGVLADQAAKKYPSSGRIVIACSANAVLLLILMSLAAFNFESALNIRNYYLLSAVCLVYGVFQLSSYVGAVKPILAEIVPHRLAGQTLAYAAGIDGAISAIAGAPVVATISEKVFGYKQTDMVIEDMPRDLRRNNLIALASGYFTVTVVSIILATAFFAMLNKTYKADKDSSEKEQENESKALIGGSPSGMKADVGGTEDVL